MYHNWVKTPKFNILHKKNIYISVKLNTAAYCSPKIFALGSSATVKSRQQIVLENIRVNTLN